MEIKFQNTKLKIALKDKDNNLIGDLYFNPEDAIQRSKMLDLYQKILQAEEKIKLSEKKIKNETDDFKKGTEVVAIEKEIFELILNSMVEIYGDIVTTLVNATGNDLGSLITLMNGLIPYYQEASNKNVSKYINSK